MDSPSPILSIKFAGNVLVAAGGWLKTTSTFYWDSGTSTNGKPRSSKASTLATRKNWLGCGHIDDDS